MKVLVTGGSGFLGKQVVKHLLKKNYKVRSMARGAQTELTRIGAEVYYGDVSDYMAVLRATSGVQAIIHTASKTGIWGRYRDYYATNVTGASNIIKACRANGIKYLVYTSTPSVVWNGESIQDGDESLPYTQSGLCAYAKTKAEAEALVLAADEVGQLSTVALRPHLIWGAGDPHLMPRILKKAVRRKLIQVGSGDNCVDMTHVGNAAYAHVLALEGLMEGQAAGKAYFVSDGNPVNLWQWIKEVLERLNLPKPKRKMSFENAYTLGFLMEKLYGGLCLKSDPPMTRFLATQLAKDHYFSIERAQHELRYQSIIKSEDGISEMIYQLSRQVKA